MVNPSKPHRLRDIAEGQGKDIQTLLIEVIEREGSIEGTARSLGISRNTVRYWMKKMGYRTETRRQVALIRDGAHEPTL